VTEFWCDAQKQQKLNVMNYKHETNALAYTFKAGSWQLADLNVLAHIFMLIIYNI